MATETLVALLSLAGTAIGSAAGILTANRLTAYRIEQLEKKMDRHNGLAERVCIAEKDINTIYRELEARKT